MSHRNTAAGYPVPAGVQLKRVRKAEAKVWPSSPNRDISIGIHFVFLPTDGVDQSRRYVAELVSLLA